MSLCIFSDKPSIKLNDAYVVNIKWDKSNTEYTVLKSCVSFTPPVAKYKKEVQNFGNNSYAFILPDWEVDDFSISLLEDKTFNIAQLVSKALQFNFDFNEENWYYTNNNIYELRVDVYDNNFNRIIYQYTYRYLKLVKYDTYSLSYEDDTVATWSLTFSYMYSKETQCNFDPNEQIIEPTKAEEPVDSSKTDDIQQPLNMQETKVDVGSREPAQGSDGHFETGGQSASDAAAAARAKAEQMDAIRQQTKKETAATNPVDLSKLSEDDRIDELAYRMMRGQLDNGKPRYEKTYKAGYNETERAAAQKVVNQMDWEGLKERHDQRVANADTHYNKNDETAVAQSAPVQEPIENKSDMTTQMAAITSVENKGAEAAAAFNKMSKDEVDTKKSASEHAQPVQKPIEHKQEPKQQEKPKEQPKQVAKQDQKKEQPKKQESPKKQEMKQQQKEMAAQEKQEKKQNKQKEGKAFNYQGKNSEQFAQWLRTREKEDNTNYYQAGFQMVMNGSKGAAQKEKDINAFNEAYTKAGGTIPKTS